MTPPEGAAAALLATALTVAIFLPYARSMVQGRTRPHPCSWLVWGLGTGVVCLAQLADGGGIGAWPLGLSAAISLAVAAFAAARQPHVAVTRADRLFLIAALAALPLWWLTDDPLTAVVLITASDLLGFGPTLRRAWHRPGDERAWFYFLGAARNALLLPALEHRSPTTWLFPFTVAFACVVVGLILVWRGRAVQAEAWQ